MDTKLAVTGLNVSFHGAGIWMGTDEDPGVRLGVINNSFGGGVSIRSSRANEDFWGGHGGLGGYI